MARVSCLLWLTAMLSAAAHGSDPCPGPSVTTQDGILCGFRNASGVDVFLGIPYAAPPVDILRWAPPQPYPAWKPAIRNATTYSAVCPQPLSPGFTFPAGTVMDENCLFLNVWAPSAPGPKTGRNVLVWIHGGSLLQGSGSEMRLVGNNMSAMGDVVVVTINYRLGSFGYLAVQAMPDSGEKTFGNYGLQDQRLALQWVRDNIAAFGGDPSKVTMMGESAGASSVCFHLMATRSFGLYHNAIAESSACFAEIANVSTAVANGAIVQSTLQCDGLDPESTLRCLRQASWQQVLSAQSAVPIVTATIDGYEFDTTSYRYVVEGRMNPVPLMAGNVENEGSGWIYRKFPDAIPPQDWRASVASMFKEAPSAIVDAIVANYTCEATDDCRPQLSFAFGDYLLLCPTAILAEGMSHLANAPPVSSYIFSHVPSWAVLPVMGAYHSSEIDFVFSTVDIRPGVTDEEYALAAAMTNAWTTFAKTGTYGPQFNASSHWDRLWWSSQHPQTKTAWRDSDCQFWNVMYEHVYQ